MTMNIKCAIKNCRRRGKYQTSGDWWCWECAQVKAGWFKPQWAYGRRDQRRWRSRWLALMAAAGEGA